jgi:hypothetical protein
VSKGLAAPLGIPGPRFHRLQDAVPVGSGVVYDEQTSEDGAILRGVADLRSWWRTNRSDALLAVSGVALAAVSVLVSTVLFGAEATFPNVLATLGEVVVAAFVLGLVLERRARRTAAAETRQREQAEHEGQWASLRLAVVYMLLKRLEPLVDAIHHAPEGGRRPTGTSDDPWGLQESFERLSRLSDGGRGEQVMPREDYGDFHRQASECFQVIGSTISPRLLAIGLGNLDEALLIAGYRSEKLSPIHILDNRIELMNKDGSSSANILSQAAVTELRRSVFTAVYRDLIRQLLIVEAEMRPWLSAEKGSKSWRWVAAFPTGGGPDQFEVVIPKSYELAPVSGNKWWRPWFLSKRSERKTEIPEGE